MTTRSQFSGVAAAKQPPEGWPVGSFSTYTEAQAAVDMLSDSDFPVGDVTIVGVNLMEVERVVGRLTWGKVLFGGAVSGAWMGLFFGFLWVLFAAWSPEPFILGIALGVIFGVVGAAVPYAATRGKRDFSSMTQIVAGRYDVLCNPSSARQARDLIAAFLRGAAGASSPNNRTVTRSSSAASVPVPAPRSGEVQPAKRHEPRVSATEPGRDSRDYHHPADDNTAETIGSSDSGSETDETDDDNSRGGLTPPAPEHVEEDENPSANKGVGGADDDSGIYGELKRKLRLSDSPDAPDVPRASDIPDSRPPSALRPGVHPGSASSGSPSSPLPLEHHPHGDEERGLRSC